MTIPTPPKHHQTTTSTPTTPSFPSNPFTSYPKSPRIIQYFNRSSRSSKKTISTNDLPFESNSSILSPTGIFYALVKMTVPLAYIYILLILWRELCYSFPKTMMESKFMNHYMYYLVLTAQTMRSSSLLVEVWAVIEGIFYVILYFHRMWLNSLDTLELSLRSAPMLEIGERADLWSLMMCSEENDCIDFIRGWFFGEELDTLTRYDVMDFLTWSLFEGRNIEHLTQEEILQLKGFVNDLEYKISIELHGVEEEDNEDDDVLGIDSDSIEEETAFDLSRDEVIAPPAPHRQHLMQNYGAPVLPIQSTLNSLKRKGTRAKPKQLFQFQGSRDDSHQSYFSDLYESYKDWCDQYRNRNFHPVQDLRDYVAEKTQQLHNVEQAAMRRTSESLSNMYSVLIEKDGTIDKGLTAISHATQSQISSTWNGVWKMKERLRTATDISTRRKALRQQLNSYRSTLAQMRSMATAVPSKQMADLMRKITQCYEALEGVETSAMDAFMQVTGYVGKSLLHSKEPPRYLKYSCDPLMDVASYPLMFHILILLVTEGGLRVMMRLRGFQRLRVGPISYYYHPGTKNSTDLEESSERQNSEREEVESVPIVFCHGIGIGLIFYKMLIDELLKLGRPLILPEIPYVSGFRPWQSPNCVLPPAAVTSSLMSILACHGHARGAFLGHSYGTSWLSFMCKNAPSAVAAVLFLDPVCFCLHCPRLTKQFVYHRADPGSTSHMIRTDVNVNWTIQRGFPWARISLFTEQIPPVPCAVFLSDQDALVPSDKVEAYLRSKGSVVLDAEQAGRDHFGSFSKPSHPINVTIFRGQGHGDWPLALSENQQVAQAASALVDQIRTVAGGEKIPRCDSYADLLR